MVVHDAFVGAMQQFHLCALKDKRGHARIVQPYGIFLTRDLKPMYCCYQVAGYTGSGTLPNWRNFPIEDIADVDPVDQGFKKRDDFNPENKDIYFKWVEHL
jgi:hypothetical protein